MTVAELIEKLQKFDDECEVIMDPFNDGSELTPSVWDHLTDGKVFIGWIL
jgi:hypothetical protein